ncbi:hypothetical protein, partial [Nocardia cyriacigeorgica]|uniref:hypothetical protein n=1 Tax=Nocardia cyriacigeorgica TaxID=135487 RepID=UPI002457AA98
MQRATARVLHLPRASHQPSLAHTAQAVGRHRESMAADGRRRTPKTPHAHPNGRGGLGGGGGFLPPPAVGGGGTGGGGGVGYPRPAGGG